MPQIIEKRCRICNQDVAQLKRTKDASGNYYCQPCFDAERKLKESEGHPLTQKPMSSRTETTRTNGQAKDKGIAAVGSAAKTTLRWVKLFAATLAVLCLVAGVLILIAPSDGGKDHPQVDGTTVAQPSAELPEIHILDSRGEVAFSNWHLEGFNLVGTATVKGPSKIDSLTYTSRSGGTVKDRGSVMVPGDVLVKGEPTVVTIVCLENPLHLDITIDVQY